MAGIRAKSRVMVGHSPTMHSSVYRTLLEISFHALNSYVSSLSVDQFAQ